jgi:transglutaminase-like putative cysteine protease
MNRRCFMFGTIAVAAFPNMGFGQSIAQDIASRVAEVQAEIVARRAGKRPITASWVASRLGDGLTERERRGAAFLLVQSIPYKLTAWSGDADSLFVLGRGDCRHKAGGLLRLLKAWKMEARPIQVPFDWADLPIPADVMKPLKETRGVHDSVEVKIEGQYVLVDATWDPALGGAGFPVLNGWDGISPTLPITPKADVVIRPGDLKAGTNVFAYLGIKPERERTLQFNRSFNAWSDDVREMVRSSKR